MSVDDLNQRVQARLDELELATQNRGSAMYMLARAIRDYDEIWAPQVASWRERWERHSADSGGRHCRMCPEWDREHDCYVGAPWPCADALSVLREIGVEP